MKAHMNKKYIYKGMAALALLAVTASCEKDTLPTNFAPELKTGSTEGIYRTGVESIYGVVNNPNGYTVEEFGIEYSLYQSFAESKVIKATELDAEGNFSVSMDGLEPGEGYFYRTYVFGGHNTVYGESRNFTTVTTSEPQFAAETNVSNVGLTSFDVAATLLDDGGDEGGIQMRAFLYMPTEGEEELTMTTPNVLMKTVSEFSTTITELYTGTRYAVCPMAVTGSGIGYGTTVYVTTTATDNTLLSSCLLSDTTINSICVEAHVLAAGTHPIVETGFCYTSENAEPTIQNLTIKTELDGTVFRATLSGLNAATTYYIRAYAKDDQGNVAYSETVEYTVSDHQDLDVVTYNADEISTISARLWGNVRDNNVPVSERGICWSTLQFVPESKKNVQNANYVVANTDSARYSIALDVDFNTTYYFCAYAKNKKGEVYYGELLSFVTPDISAPVLVMNDVTEVTDSTANISASFSLDYEYRDDYAIKCGFLISAGNAEPTLEVCETQISCDVVLDAHLTSDIVEVPFNGRFRSLAPNTTYYYRAYVKNEKELIYSEVKSFKSLKLTPSSGDAEFPDLNK